MKTLPPTCLLFLLLGMLLPINARAQYPPPAGQPGSTAIHKDSSAIVAWATHAVIGRGYINFVDTSITYEGENRATYGSYLYASGPSDEYMVSLGDHGSAVLTFESPIVNGTGPDFAVFENAFGDDFLELAFVEVSSDGQRFVRFPAVSLTQDSLQVPSFGTLDATKIHNLAGKYRLEYGTPFDLDDIRDSVNISLDHISHIRITDVGGCVMPHYAAYDSQGHRVNDPWPTPFGTGGFDLDAVGVIHNTLEGIDDSGPGSLISLYPTPVTDMLTVITPPGETVDFNLSDLAGKIMLREVCKGRSLFSLGFLRPGIYLATFSFGNGFSLSKKIVRN